MFTSFAIPLMVMPYQHHSCQHPIASQGLASQGAFTTALGRWVPVAPAAAAAAVGPRWRPGFGRAPRGVAAARVPRRSCQVPWWVGAEGRDQAALADDFLWGIGVGDVKRLVVGCWEMISC